jgi:hypothetical protein
MGKHDRKTHTLLNKLTTFVLMISLTLGTSKGRTFIDSVIGKSNLLEKGIKIGFKVFLYISVLLMLYIIKKWTFG